MSVQFSLLEFTLKKMFAIIEKADIKITTNMKVKASFDKIDENKFLLAFEIELAPEQKEEAPKNEVKSENV